MLRNNLLLMIISIAWLFLGSSKAQYEPRSDKYTLEIYPEVMNLVFPREKLNANKNSRKLVTQVITIRVSPSFKNEYQISFCQYFDGEVQGTILKLQGVKNGVWGTLVEMSKKSELDSPKAMAGRFAIEKTKLPDSLSLRKLLTQLIKVNVAALSESDIVLDGSKYEFWCETRSGEIYVSAVDGSQVRNKQLLDWIKKVESVVKTKEP